MRYIIGVDLGTTNSCICFVDTQDPKLSIQLFRVPQLHALGHLEALPTLPSFCLSGTTSALPWNKSSEYSVGTFAREEGAKTPTKLVESAKSWLCHTAANRREKILPFEAAAESDKISPVEASSRYLSHLKEAWNHTKAKGHDDARFEEQDIVLTVPASFDEPARLLTTEAARQAGIKQLTLLEEPQAAFYSWIAQHEASWKETLKAGDQILVCDVGGGTTDFSLIEVHDKNGELSLQRMSVGDHLLLGGDNMDLTIASRIEKQLFTDHSRELPITQWLQLRHQARKAKELLLDEESKQENYRFLLQGTGSNVVATTQSTEISRQEIQQILTDGFFPELDWALALDLKRSTGVKTMGLPYETEPAITKHLASFLRTSGDHPIAPDYVLFNGGAMKPTIFRNAVLASLCRWFPNKQPKTLPSYHLDLAVGRGAAYYGRVRQGLGVRIGGGSARSYYLGLDVCDQEGNKTRQALTLLPRGSEEDASFEPEQVFMLRPNVPVSFTLYSSHVRLHDESGMLVPIDPNEMQPLPPIQTLLRFGKGQSSDQPIPVRMGMASTAIGTLSLWLQAGKSPHRWDLEFQLRTTDGKEQTDEKRHNDQTFDISFLNNAREIITQTFSGNGKMDTLMERLESSIEIPRKEWPPSILRGLWETVWKLPQQIKNASDTDARWWNLAGFLLRPGFGYPLDDFRLKEFWKIVLSDLKTTRSPETEIQRWICLRRVAGGLNRGQQAQIAAELWPQLIDKKTGKIGLKGKNETYLYIEKLRTAGSLELVECSQKIKLGQAILTRMEKESPLPVEYWTLGRLGARHLFYGSATNVIPRETAVEWMRLLLTFSPHNDSWFFAMGQIGRKTDHRELNLPNSFIQELLSQCQEEETKFRLKTFLTDVVPLTQNEQNQLFGEHLPPGLSLHL